MSDGPQSAPEAIRFRFSPDKAMAALHWMVSQRPGVDLHTALKSCYFADRQHLNRHRRPIFGATYRAMRFGPVPLEVYEMAKGEPLWLAELNRERFPWGLRGFQLVLIDNAAPDLDALSPSDLQSLEEGFHRSASLTFDERTAATHGRDWQRAKLGTMAYEDMLEEGPERAALIEYLREKAPYIRL